VDAVGAGQGRMRSAQGGSVVGGAQAKGCLGRGVGGGRGVCGRLSRKVVEVFGVRRAHVGYAEGGMVAIKNSFIVVGVG
jgi:hypothetical protein